MARFVTVVDNSNSYNLKRLFSAVFVYFGVELSKNTKCFILHGIGRDELSAHYPLRITFLMLPAKNCKHAFEYVKVIIHDILSAFSTSDTIKVAFSMTS